MSIHEEATPVVVQYVMGVFTNLVRYEQHIRHTSLKDIVPDLADSWSWSADGKDLTFKLHPGVKWHDGAAFTAADVRCTWELLLDRAAQKLRLNPRRAWWNNVEEVAAPSDDTAVF